MTMRAIGLATLCLISMSVLAFAQTDEIQVYDGEIAPPGIFNLMIHNNFTPKGRTVPDYPGAIIANHSYQVTAEWAYGVTPWFEQGLYMPVTSPYSSNYGSTINGFKIRELFARPNAHDHKFFYAANFEFSVNHSYWESRTITSEIRPIVGLHLHQWDFIYNPIVDTDYTGGLGNLQYNPRGEWRTTSTTGGPLPRKSMTASARCTGSCHFRSNFTKSGRPRIIQAASFSV
jgi:hypothetical protein